jgi:hypothetical protein
MEYVVNDHYRTESLRDFLKKQRAIDSSMISSVGLKVDPLFGKPPFALDRSRFPASKPLLVIFEKPGCTDCAEFHSVVLADKKIRKILKRLVSHCWSFSRNPAARTVQSFILWYSQIKK